MRIWPRKGGFGLALLAGLGLAAAMAAGPDTRVIRLRNQTINTPERSPAPAAALLAEPLTRGLVLLQFTNHFQAEWRAPLLARGVTPLKYVPDDAFIARVDAVRLGEIRSLPFVRWVGLYEPRLKVHPRLLGQVATLLPGGGLEVRALLAPGTQPAEVAGLIKSFQSVTRRASPSQGILLSGKVSPRGLTQLAASPAVLWIEPAGRMRLFDEVATKIVAGDNGAPATFATVHALGYDGRDVTVAVADSGLDIGEAEGIHPDFAGRVDAFFAYGGLPDASDEHSHGTHVAGIVAGNAATGDTDDLGNWFGLGVAPGAHLVAQRLFDGAGNYFAPPSYEALTRDAVRSGAVIGSNSWGDDTQGEYDLSAAQFDALVRDADALTPGEQPYILEFSAGNSGPGAQTIGSPAVAKNVIATGACQNNRFDLFIYAEGQEVMADFSSRGPCEDGRIKPDVVAPGTWIASAKSQLATDENAWSPINDNYMYQGGTSQAGPHASGAAAVFVQYYRATHAGLTPSPALVKAALINSAVDMGIGWVPSDNEDGELVQVGDTGPVPNDDEGWGRIDLTELIGTDRRYDWVDQTTLLHTGQVYEQRVVVSPNAPLKLTLVYTDAPALPAAIPALVNDLDLEVTAPDGRLYRGNAFAEGESVSGTTAGDRINNVEAVHLAEPLPGEYLIRVRAQNVVEDVHHRTDRAPEQDFALVVSGDLPSPGEGVVFFDRAAYRAPTNAVVRLIDADLAGQSQATVRVTSDTEPAGEAVTLRSTGAAGVFTNLVSLVTSAASAGDGQVQVAHGDTLRIVYADARPPGERTAAAVVDLQPPGLSSVGATNQFGRTRIVWTSDEPADGRVVFGVAGSVSNVVSQAGFRLAHAIELPPLEAGQAYQFYVVSSDVAGNVRTNDNAGALFGFIGAQAAPALLVYAPELLFSDLLGEYPGIENWTAALDQLGISYEIWDTQERGRAPKAEELKPFRVVLWRPEEFQDPTPGIQAALSDYFAAGGSVFVASYDVLSRLIAPSDEAFKSNVLHVASYVADQGADLVEAVAGDPVGAGAVFAPDYSAFPDTFGLINWPEGPDALVPAADAAAVFKNDAGQTVGLRFPRTGQDSQGRVVFCAFALEAVPFGDGVNDRVTLLGNALEFLVPGLRGLSSVAFDRGAYSVPAAVTVEVADSNRAGAGRVTVSVRSSTEPAAQDLSLAETVRKGIFRALVPLVPANQPQTAGQLRAANGDAIEARYTDANARESLTTAAVDTIPAVISGVVTEPAYNEATVMWETDKATDALVRFGEGGGDDSFLTRSAYAAELSGTHVVQLTGLLPDRDYYFYVSSRDVAGNNAREDNGGRYFKVRTLKPVSAPWSDDLERGRAGWAVLNDDQAVDEETGENLVNSGWLFGVPQNAYAIAAHSGTNCWATNLQGDQVDLAISDLISPAIDLTGGNQATLRFWHWYDFTERNEFLDIEAGQVAVSTDNGATWDLVYTITDDMSLDWTEVEVDLSKYAGKVIRVRWNYQLFSFESYPRPGWFVDDVSVSLDTRPTGVLEVRNNLAQAGFTLAGPLTNAATGALLRLTNAPIGSYVVTWEAVPYYQTPAPQTNALTAGAPLVFTGNYTFPDTNANGISDLWEQHFLGGVSPNHPPATDSDGDGASDLSEFLAGTDPKNAGSRLELRGPIVQANRTVRFEWPGAAGREYVLEISTDLVHWEAASEAQRGRGETLAVTLPALDPQVPYAFRVRVTP